MNYDIFEPIPPTFGGEETPENRRIVEVANELARRCQLYEAQLRDSKGHGRPLEIEQRATELLAKESGLWMPFEKIFSLGVPGPSGHENDTFVSKDIIYKVNNLLNAGGILKLFKKIICHNILFYDTAYQLYGFTGFEGRTIMPVLQQQLIRNARPATPIEIDTYMAALDFQKGHEDGYYHNDTFVVWDILPRNVLKDDDGDIFVIDAEIKRIKQ